MVTLSLSWSGTKPSASFHRLCPGPGHHIMVILTQFLLISPKLSPFGLLPRVISIRLSVLPFDFHPGRNFGSKSQNILTRCHRFEGNVSYLCDNMTYGARGNSTQVQMQMFLTFYIFALNRFLTQTSPRQALTLKSMHLSSFCVPRSSIILWSCPVRSLTYRM